MPMVSSTLKSLNDILTTSESLSVAAAKDSFVFERDNDSPVSPSIIRL